MSANDENATSSPNPHDIWVQAVKNMEAIAWEDLLKYYAEELRRDIEISLRKRGLPANLSDDIEQETWLTALEKIRDFHWENDEKFYHWLRAISLNHIHTYRRIQQKGWQLDDFHDSRAGIGSPDELIETRLLGESSLEDEIIFKEQFLALDQALRTLSPENQEIFIRWLMGEKPKQLALIYEIKPSSVSMLILRAKEKIRASLRALPQKGDQDD